MKAKWTRGLLLLAALSCPTWAQEPAGGSASPQLFNTEDLIFLGHMSMHHRQAVEMGALVPARSDREEFIRFARYVARAQESEIRAMRSLLALAEERGLSVPEHTMQGDPPMPGMLSSSEMAALEDSSGAQFERRWLEGMIFHHEGGLAMAHAQQLQQLKYGRRPYGFHVLVEDILVEQRAEITRMRDWLEEWGLSRTGDSRDPAAGVTSPAPGAAVAMAETVIIGTALDDTAVAAVEVGIRDLGSGRWWRGGGEWGDYQGHPARLTRSGPGSVAWRFDWTPPEAGRYGIQAVVVDGAGKRATSDQYAFRARE